MIKSKGKQLAPVTEAARQAGAQLAAFSSANPEREAVAKLTGFRAVDANASRILKHAEESAVTSENFAEFRFNGASVQGVVKAGQCVLKVNC